jgi:hypothetical protein
MLSLLDEQKWKYTFDVNIFGQLFVLGIFCLIFLTGSYIFLKRKDSL